MTAAGCAGCARRSTPGLTAEAAVERVQNDARATCSARPIPICASGCTISTTSPTGCCTSSPARATSPTRAELPENAIIVARTMGPAALLDYDRTKLRGLVLEEGGPSSHVAIVARALGIADGRPGRRTSSTSSSRAMPSSSTARPARCMCARRRTSRTPMPKRRGCAPAGRSNIASCATSPPSPGTASRSRCT